jgi:hypothetical protein
MIELPVDIRGSAINSKRIFLSATPLVLISTISNQLQHAILSIGNTCQVTSFKKPLTSENATNQNIFLCGDVTFKEIPTFLRGLKSKQSFMNEFNPGHDDSWVILRVSEERSGDFLFECLFSTDIDNTGLNIMHSSWCEPEAAEIRFSKSKSFKVKHSPESQQINNSRIVDINSDFEFIN